MSIVGWNFGRKQTLRIANGTTDSANILDLSINPNTKIDVNGTVIGSRTLRTWDLLIDAPPALTGTVKLMVCDTATGTFIPLQSGGSDITVPAGKSTPISPFTARFLKLVSGGAEGADRDFIISGIARNIGR